jgi:hypothetical protein
MNAGKQVLFYVSSGETLRGGKIRFVPDTLPLRNLVNVETAHAERTTFELRRRLDIGVVRRRKSCVAASSDKRRGSRRPAAQRAAGRKR